MTTTQDQWERSYADNTFDGSQDVNNQARYKVIGEALKGCSTVLDVGCGVGHLQSFVNGRYTGIDLSSVAIEKAKAIHCTGTFLQADATKWESLQKFDGVVLNEILYYMDDPAAVLRRYWSMCNTTLIVSVYDKTYPLWRINKNRRALRIARHLAGRNLEEEIPVEQNGKKWSVLVIHP